MKAQCHVCHGDLFESLCGGMGGHRTERLCHCHWTDMQKTEHAFEWVAYWMALSWQESIGWAMSNRPGLRPRSMQDRHGVV